MTRRPSPEALREAARLAREEGVSVRMERDGWVYEIAPAEQDKRHQNPADLVDMSE